ncbi:MAG TPA: serine hydrolase domain-containing protein [Candidatus Cybelea sp.]|nr:serine hydrolase domain-containing protein [Candidatus Cybelea sp.]
MKRYPYTRGSRRTGERGALSKRRNPVRLGAFVVLAFAAGVCHAAAQEASQTLSPQEEAKIAKMLAESGVPSISVAIVENGETSYVRAFGRASMSPDRAADRNTRYAVGSISKQFTAAIVLLLAERGELSLDDRVGKYFPDLTRANEVTIRDLLSHTSGYEDYAPQDYNIPEWLKPTTPEAILDKWAKKPLDFDPGTKWQYSNTNYVLAGRIAEKAAGQPLMAMLREKIFEPLGMTSAGDCSVDQTPDDAVAYTRYGLGPARPALREAKGWYFAAGELCMTPADLAKWNISFLKETILSPASYEEFRREVRLKDGDYTHYALGLHLGDLDNVPAISHSGEVSGFLATNWIFPTRNAAVTVLSNQDDIELVDPLAEEIARYLLEPERRQHPTEASAEELRQVRSMVEGLAQGRIDRALLTSNLDFYFNETALRDMASSLGALGAVKEVRRIRESLRGGMRFRIYRVQFEKKALLLTVYLMPDGRYEQFLPVEEF